MIYLMSFFSAMFMTALLGFQSKNVNQSRIGMAMMTSALITVCNLVIIRVAGSNDIVQILLMMAGGCIGIALSIVIHDRFLKKHEDAN